MQGDSKNFQRQEQEDQIHEVVDRMLAPFGKSSKRGRTFLGRTSPFDTTKPNQHDSKAEFQREQSAVKDSLLRIKSLIENLTPNKENAEQREMVERLMPIINEKLRSNAPSGKIEEATDLIRRNIADVGGYFASIYIMIDLFNALRARQVELKDQEDKFWNLSHRAPDYYARAIAHRLAKLYARETGQKPTIGTSGVSGDPSTAYTRALSEVFAILGITSGTRSPAEWAVAQLTEEDLNPSDQIFGGLFGFDTGQRPQTDMSVFPPLNEETPKK